MSALKGIAVAPLLSSLHLAIALADDPPKLDITTTCNAAAQFALAGGRDREGCLGDEHEAENTIGQNWSKYNAVDKTQCVGTVKTGRQATWNYSPAWRSCGTPRNFAKAIRRSGSTGADTPSP